MLQAHLGATETDPSWRGDVQEISLFIPSVGVDLEAHSSLLEKEGSVLVHHTEQTRAAGSSVEPEDDGIVIGISLGIEEDVVEGGSIEVEHACIGNDLPEYHL